VDGKKPEFVAGALQHKKYLHQYQVQNFKWTDVDDSIFNGQRRDFDLNDESQ
jgi:hypothetical protein